MVALVTGSLLLSLLHAIIPNHWLPVLAIGRKENWSLTEILKVTTICGLCHVVSTLFIGWSLALFGWELSQKFRSITSLLAPVVLIGIGLVFIYRHYKHKHFHLADQPHKNSKVQMIVGLSLAMFFSPCLEIEAYFLAAGTESIGWVFILSAIYFFVTLLGMVFWISVAYHSSNKFNWHRLEHNTGIITGVTLIVTGVISFFFL
jgi:nickel/cobalt exporter